MRNKLIIGIFLVLFFFAFQTEPVEDAFDALGGATTDTFDPLILDSIAGASENSGYYEDDDEHEDDHDEDEDDEDEEEDDD